MEDSKKMMIVPSGNLEVIGAIANQIAREGVLERYQMKHAPETMRRQKRDIALFEAYIKAAGVFIENMHKDLEQWRGITYGLVEGFQRWLHEEGYAIGSVNVRLSTIKTYCQLAAQANILTDTKEINSIQGIKGHSQLKEVRNVDADRKTRGIATRHVNAKKAQSTIITVEQASMLKQQPETDLGKRDSFLLCLLLDLALRCSEVSGLTVGNLDLVRQPKILRVYRTKVGDWKIYELGNDVYIAAKRYIETLPDEQKTNLNAPLFAGVNHRKPNETDITRHLQTRAINKRIGQLGETRGIDNLSPHDLRHYVIDLAIRSGKDLKKIQSLGGWSSPAMALKYAHDAAVANEGITDLPGMNTLTE